jgi:hypothetical protein
MKLEDYVLHKTIGHAGTVIGYGKRLVDGNYLPTLKVRLSSSVINSRGMLVEDLISSWRRSNIEDDVAFLYRDRKQSSRTNK